MKSWNSVVVVLMAAIILSVAGCTTASDAQPQAQAVPQTQPQAQAVPQTQPQAQAVPQTQPQAQAVPQTQPQAQAVQWSCAGPAPANITEAAKVLGLSAEDTVLTTVLYPKPGDSTPIGYVIGTSASEAMGKQVHVSILPTCTTVDYDPRATSVTGTVAHEYTFHPKWKRVTMASVGTASGLKLTVYWTPGVYPDGATYGISNVKSEVKTETKTEFKCPTVADVQTTLISDGGCLMAANGPKTIKVESPFVKAVYDAGNSVTKTAVQGETITTWTATFYTKE